MSYRCDNCDKSNDYGHRVSHAKNRTNTLRKPNLHSAKVILDGSVVKQKLCTKCLRAAVRPARVVAETVAA
jgi:large subunit ribosomal protein L28